jgi:hypothetical protein
MFAVATYYRVDSPGFEPRWEARDFQSTYHSRRALGPTQPPVHWLPGFIPEGRVAGPCVDHPLQSIAKAKNELNHTSTPLCASYGMLQGNVLQTNCALLVLFNSEYYTA